MHALSLLRASKKVNIFLVPQGRGESKCSTAPILRSIWSAPTEPNVWRIFSMHYGRTANITVKMPRAHTFGARHVITTSTGRKQYGMVLKYPMAQSETTLDPLRRLHAKLKAHLAKPSVFTLLLPQTTRDMVRQINYDAPDLPSESKTKIFTARVHDKVDALFGADSSFMVYTDCNTIVLGVIDVPESMASSDFLNRFSAQGTKPYVCLADAIINLYAIVVSHDEEQISLDIRIEHISHGANIQHAF